MRLHSHELLFSLCTATYKLGFLHDVAVMVQMLRVFILYRKYVHSKKERDWTGFGTTYEIRDCDTTCIAWASTPLAVLLKDNHVKEAR